VSPCAPLTRPGDREQSLDTQLALKTAHAELEQRNELLGACFSRCALI
jgi:hypothetical protein